MHYFNDYFEKPFKPVFFAKKYTSTSMLINNTNILLNSGIKLNRIIDEKELFFK